MPDASPRRLDLAGIRILVVEDDSDSAEALQRMIELFGATVHVAGSGPDGLELARRMRPHLILADIVMPDMDGYEFLRSLHAIPEIGATPVFAVSGFGRASIQRSWEEGFNGHLAKPVSFDSLAAELRRVFWAHS